ncbi:MAG: DUF6644 family protein [Pseudomonadota bacterium]
MRDLIVTLNETPWSVALRESLFVWPILEATHVLSIMLFAGTILMVDIRILGWAYKGAEVSDFTKRILPWTVAGFVLLLTTGIVLFYAKPLVYYHNVFFRLKMTLVLFAMANILYFHRKLEAAATEVVSATPPRAARISAGVSLTLWTVVIVAGRMIAYDWYDCRKLTPGGFLSTIADCPAPVATAMGE